MKLLITYRVEEIGVMNSLQFPYDIVDSNDFAMPQTKEDILALQRAKLDEIIARIKTEVPPHRQKQVIDRMYVTLIAISRLEPIPHELIYDRIMRERDLSEIITDVSDTNDSQPTSS
jgi:hypothetical protein